MKALAILVVLSALALVFVPSPMHAEDKQIDPGKYAAIAFSPKTGKYGFSWNHNSQADAEKAALAELKDIEDAKNLSWVKFGWTVLVVSADNAYGYDTSYGEGATEGEVIEKAITQLRKHSKEKIKTIVVVCSGDVKPKVLNLAVVK
jgi:hypothetical protein